MVADLAAYEQFLKQKLTRLDGIASIESSFALEQVKYTTALPTEHLIRRATTGGPGSAKRQRK